MNAAHETHLTGADLGAYGQLAIAATLGVTDLVETLHRTITDRTAPLGPAPRQPRTQGLTGLVYASIRGITRGVGGLLDLALAPLGNWRRQTASSAARDTWLAALNGVIGDRLAVERSALAIPMQLRLRDGTAWRHAPVEALSHTGDRLLVLVHGLCMHPRQWRRKSRHDHGAALADALGLVPLYLHYNSGEGIAENGRRLSAQLTALIANWPRPVTQLHLVGHSMGGLLIRAACGVAREQRADWLRVLRSLAFLGTPHRGSPIERAGEWLHAALANSPYALPVTALGALRSSGIQDLRHGQIGTAAAAEWPATVAALAVAACGGPDGQSLRERLLGDGLVPVNSALGRAAAPDQPNLFRPAQQRIVSGVDHFGLLDAQPVYPLLRAFVSSAMQRTRSRGR